MTSTMVRKCLTFSVALAALTATGAAPGVIISTTSDPAGDTLFKDVPAFQDFIRAHLTKSESGDFHLLMEMAGPVPDAPPLPPHGKSEIWWFWIFDLDPASRPVGYPWKESAEAANENGTPEEKTGRPPEFIVYVSWDGTKFAGSAIDRRPLLTGGKAIITPVPFSINGEIVEAVVDSELIGDVPASFGWGPFTFSWSGPVGSEGVHFADYSEERGVFNP